MGITLVGTPLRWHLLGVMGGVCSADSGNSLGDREETVHVEPCCQQGMTAEEFVEHLTAVQSRVDNLTSAAGPKTKSVTVNVELIETILIDDDDGELLCTQCLKRASDRKGTGYVTRGQVDRLRNRVSFQLDDPSAEMDWKSQPAARKGTGFVTTAKLLEFLNEISDGEDDGPSSGVAASKLQLGAGPEIKCAPNRTGRKGTGFVTKAKLNKVLAIVGNDEDS